jgi:hypothetical protein
MTRVLALDGPVYRALAAWWGWVRVGLVWWLGCLPLVTAPVMTLWLLHATRRRVEGRAEPGLAETLRFVRARLRPASALGLIHAGVLALLAVAALGPSPGGGFDVALPAAVLGVGITWALVAPWSLVLLEQRDDGARAALHAAYVRAMSRPLLACYAAAGTAGCAAAVVLGPPQVGLLLVLTAPGAVATLLVRTCDRAGAPPHRPCPPSERSLS